MLRVVIWCGKNGKKYDVFYVGINYCCGCF